MELCPVDCQWGDWQSWSECSKPWLGCKTRTSLEDLDIWWSFPKKTITCHWLNHGRIYLYIYMVYTILYIYTVHISLFHVKDYVRLCIFCSIYIDTYLPFDGYINFVLPVYMASGFQEDGRIHSFFWDSNSGRFDFCVGISRWKFATRYFWQVGFTGIWWINMNRLSLVAD